MPLFLVGLPGVVSAQEQVDSLAIDTLSDNNFLDDPVFTETTYGDGRNLFVEVDTTLDFLQRYNPAKRAWFPQAYLSNLGAPSTNRWFDFKLNPGLNTGRTQFNSFLWQTDSLHYYRTTAPFTDFYYMLGQNTEQLFHIFHTQNFGRDLNIAVEFERAVSEGFYLNDRNTFSNLAITGWWQTKDRRYRVAGSLLHNDVLNEESGGVRPDSLFTNYPGPTALAEPWLDNAATDWNIWKGSISQMYDFGTKETITTDEDSSYTYFVPKVRLKHDLSFFNNRFLFLDASNDRSYYIAEGLGTDTISAISDFDGWSTSLNLFNIIGQDTSRKLHPFLWDIGIKYIDANLSDPSGSYDQEHLLTNATFNWSLPFEIPINLLILANYDLIQQNYFGKAKIMTGDSVIHSSFSVSSGFVQPTWIMRQFTGISNEYSWTLENQLSDISYQQADAILASQALLLRFKISYSYINNYTYLSKVGSQYNQPQQDEAAQVWQVRLEKDFRVRNFVFRQAIGYQRSPGSNINIPEWLADASWFYERKLFDSALGIQAGIDLWWVSDYTADGFDPVSGMFYLQSEQVLSFTPVADLFINFDIKSFRFFAKVDYINQGLFTNGYFEAPLYPMQNRALKFGINWHLYY